MRAVRLVESECLYGIQLDPVAVSDRQQLIRLCEEAKGSNNRTTLAVPSLIVTPAL
jgi:hypothetical protein